MASPSWRAPSPRHREAWVNAPRSDGGTHEFTNGKPDGEAVHMTCFGCHEPGKDRDFVFTEYAP
jgi:hypothetical protein